MVEEDQTSAGTKTTDATKTRGLANAVGRQLRSVCKDQANHSATTAVATTVTATTTMPPPPAIPIQHIPHMHTERLCCLAARDVGAGKHI